MNKRFGFVMTVLAVLCGLAVGAAPAQTDMSRFPLAKGIPADVFIAVAARGNPERKFLEDYWAEVGKAFADSGITDGIWDLVMESVPDEKADQFDEAKERLSELFWQVKWGDLFHREMIYAGRFPPLGQGGGVMYEGLLAGRMDRKEAPANYAALKALLEEVNKLIRIHGGEDVVSLKETKDNGVAITTLSVHPTGAPPVPVVALAQWEDLVLFSFGGDGILRDSLALLKGEAKQAGLTESARFKNAFAGLPPAEDSLTFFDIEAMLSPMRGLFQTLSTKKPATTQPANDNADSDDVQPWLRLATALLDDVSVGDYMASVEWTEDYRVFTETNTALRSEARSKPIYELIAGNKAVESWEKYIPKEADQFSCTSGISLSRLYRYVIGFVKKDVPGGADLIKNFEQMQKEWELDIDKDILSLFEGQICSAKMGQRQFVMFKVTDEKKANEQLTRLVNRLKEHLGEQSPLMISEVTIAGDKGFIQFVHPWLAMLAPGMAPVIGCADGYLIFGTSPEVVSLCLDTARGKHPNITRNERWQKEAMAPKTGAVDSIRFADETNSAAEAQQVCQLLSVGLGMLPLAGNLPPETSKMISAITPLLGKFSIVVGKMDFYQSSAEYSTFDGKQWRTRKVQNYKTPQPKSPGEEEAKGAQAENKPAGKAETKKAKPEKHDQEKAGKTDQKDKAEPKPGKSRGS